MTNVLNLINNSDNSVIGTIRLRPNGSVQTKGNAAAVWKTFRRFYSADRPAFEAILDAGWSNGHFSLVPRDRPA